MPLQEAATKSACYITAYDFSMPQLCCHVLGTLALLMRHNTKAKKEFENLRSEGAAGIGYELLGNQLLVCLQGTMTSSIYQSLLGMLVEGPFLPSSDVQNPNVLMLMLNLLQQQGFDNPKAAGVLTTLSDVMESSLHNQIQVDLLPFSHTGRPIEFPVYMGHLCARTHTQTCPGGGSIEWARPMVPSTGAQRRDAGSGRSMNTTPSCCMCASVTQPGFPEAC